MYGSPDGNADLCKSLKKIYDSMKNRFENSVGSRMRDVRDYILPELGMFDGEDRKVKTSDRARRIIKSTAELSNNTLASGFQNGMTPPDQKWFLWRPSDNNLLEAHGAREWFDEVERIMFQVLASSNFYDTMHGSYIELAPFGIIDVFMEEDSEKVCRFTQLPGGSYYWATDERNDVDTVFRVIEYTARQLADKYGEDALCDGTKEKLRKDPEQTVKCLHAVMPRTSYNIESHFAKDMPYASYVLELENINDDSKLLEESGYREFPHLVARWSKYGSDVYSMRCPGFSSLPDVRHLQEAVKDILQTAHLAAKPPMRVPTSYKGRLKLVPGGQNFVSTNAPDAVAPLYQVNPAVIAPLSEWVTSSLVPEIERHFYTDVFRMFTGEERSGVTATEVLERKQEKMLELGPIVTRFQRSILDPMLIRLFGILDRRGMIPPLPEALSEATIDIQYVSVLAQAQKGAQRNAINSVIESVGNMAQLKPDVLDKIDFDQAVDELHDISGAPAKILRSDDAVRAIREANLKAQQEAQAMQSAQATAGVAQQLSGVSTETNNVAGAALERTGAV